MTDVNEEIVRKYFELKGYLVRTNVKFLKKKEVTGKKSSGYGDIDLAVINPNTGERAIVAVSGWHTERITPSYVRDWGHRLFGFLCEASLDKAERVLGCKDFRKILIVSQLGALQESKDKFIEEARKRGVDDVIEFPKILKELIEEIEISQSYDSEVLQTIRLLKRYDFLKNTARARVR